MSKSDLSRSIELFVQAVQRLAEACARPEDPFIRDAVIQRFEFSYELAWKLLKRKLAGEGIEVGTPRQAIQQSVAAGLIEDGNLWTELLRMRNLTSHTYDEALAIRVYRFVCSEGLPAFRTLAKRAEEWGGD